MKYLFIEGNAAQIIAQERTFQSGDYSNSLSLLNFILNSEDCDMAGLKCKLADNIGFIYAKKGANIDSWILFDLKELDFSGFDENEKVTIILKIVKFAVKYWNNLPLTNSEKIIEGNAILFPFPYVDNDPYKIKINLTPSDKLTNTRNIKCMVVEQIGLGHLARKADITTSAYKEIIKAAQQNCIAEIDDKENIETNSIESLCENQLTSSIDRSKEGFMSFKQWEDILSDTQKRFVFMDLHRAERLEGAAGTGKTIALILRACYLLSKAEANNEPIKILFLCHSIATLAKIKEQFRVAVTNQNYLDGPEYSPQSIEITTLQQWSVDYLGNIMGHGEMLDEDAQECKDVQRNFIIEKFDEACKNDLPSLRQICSEEFIDFLDKNPRDVIVDLIASEISVTIKGRAEGDLHVYKELPRLQGTLPLKENADFVFIYRIYENYQKDMETLGYFDNDDVSISASMQLRTPIWQRRRLTNGYDVVIIDEMHLFSFNEMNIFHHLCKESRNQNIIYAIDKSQAVGDRGQTDDSITKNLAIGNSKDTKLNTVFRSSPQIINLAFSVLGHGVSLFKNFENPLNHISVFQNDSSQPIYKLADSDSLIDVTLDEIANIESTLKIPRYRILIITASHELEDRLAKYMTTHHKPCIALRRRGDYSVVDQAQRNNQYIHGYIDYVGGLEFEAVIIVGVDKGRAPAYSGIGNTYYQEYEWHNRLYVAITRAQKHVTIIGSRNSGESILLETAINNNYIQVQ